MSFLNSVTLPGGGKPTSNSGGSFLKSVVMPTPEDTKIANLQQQDAQVQRDVASQTSTGAIIKNTLSGIGNTFKNIGAGLYNNFVKPSSEQQNFESTYLPYASNADPLTKTLTAPGVAAARIITRFINPGLQPLANNLAEIQAINEKGGIADQVAAGKIPPSYLDEIAVLHKTAPQIVGDVAQAVLTAYAGGEGAVAIEGKNVAKLTIPQIIKQGAIKGLGIGTAFGGAQAASSGSTNPIDIASTVAQGGLVGGILGAITSGAIPVSKELLGKAKEAEKIYNALPLEAKTIPTVETPTSNVKGGFLESVQRPEGSTQRLTSFKGTGETVTRGLAESTESSAVAADLTKTFGDLPEYQRVNMADQASKATDIIKTDPELAKRIAMGEENAPKGIIPESVYTAVKLEAIKNGDVETLRDLATKSQLIGEATTMGQRIKALDSGNLEGDPVRAIQDIQKARGAVAEKSTGKSIQRASADVVGKEIQPEIVKAVKTGVTKQTWEQFIEQIKCNY